MTVSLGPKRLLGASTLLGASQFLGQGNTNTAKDIEWVLMFSTDDAFVSIPSWVDISSYMRAFSTSRGRSSELSDVDAGTASITLDNRSRVFDPTNTSGAYYPNLRPMNRVWLRLRFNGLTHDVFTGYVESYEQQLPELGLDAVTVVHAADEFKVLALRNQPTSDPPRDTYADVVQFDRPVAYWEMRDYSGGFAENATVGQILRVDQTVSNGMSSLGSDGGIVGDNGTPYMSLQLNSTQYLLAEDNGELDFGLYSSITVEMWIKPQALPAGSLSLIRGPSAQYFLTYNTTGTMSWGLTGNAPSGSTITSSTLPLNQWTHVCGTYDGSNTRLYIDGVQVATAAYTDVLLVTAATLFRLGNPVATSTIGFDEIAVYRSALSASRVAAHYTAGAQRGFVVGQLGGERIAAVLDAITSQTPRNLQTGIRSLAGQWTGNGQPTLDVLREAENAEAVDAVLFIASDGTVTFLDGGYRSVSPWDTVQATFGDGGGTELDYMDIQLDYSDSFIANTWNVTRDGGTTQSATDTTSKNRYLERPQSLAGLKLQNDSDALDVANDMLAKYKEPFTRVLSITPKTMNTTVLDAVFPLEIGDRIRVLLTPPGGGARVDQTLFVQSITVDATPQAVFPTVKLGVSPV